jgi:hypothetical protein
VSTIRLTREPREPFLLKALHFQNMPKKGANFIDWRDDWRNCQAKKLLIQDFETGLLSFETSFKVAHTTREEYKEVEIRKFQRNFESLKKSLARELARAKSDSAGLARDKQLVVPKLSRTRWEGSEAQALLRQDMLLNLHKNPKQLWQSRSAYLEFELKTFRDHIYKEEGRQKRVAKHRRQSHDQLQAP